MVTGSNHASEDDKKTIKNMYELSSWWLVLLPVILAALLGVILLIVYLKYFHNGISHKQEYWGEFGDFFGGVLNPIVSLLTLLVVAVSLRYTEIALRLSYSQIEDEAKKQKDRRDEEQDAQRKQRTFELHMHWISPEMQQRRSEVLDILHRSFPTPPIEQTKYLGKWRTGKSLYERNNYYKLRAIWEFMANINTLYEADIMDEKLMFDLFKESLTPWVDWSDVLDMKASDSDDSVDSMKEVVWFQHQVRTLAHLLSSH